MGCVGYEVFGARAGRRRARVCRRWHEHLAGFARDGFHGGWRIARVRPWAGPFAVAFQPEVPARGACRCHSARMSSARRRCAVGAVAASTCSWSAQTAGCITSGGTGRTGAPRNRAMSRSEAPVWGSPRPWPGGANRLDVFVVGTDGALYHKWWNGSAWGPSQSGLEAMGGNLVQSPVSLSTGANHLDVFCVHAGDHVLLQIRSEEHTSELQSLRHLVCRLLL